MRRPRTPTLTGSFSDMKSDYAAMTESRFRRRRPGVSSMGGPGDWHYYSEAAFVRMREYVRAMIRDDSAAEFLVCRAVDNTIGGTGFTYEPDTGDKDVNDELKARQTEWATDPRLCDLAGERSFQRIEWLTAFNTITDGDLCVTGTEDGQLQVFEADELATPKKSVRNIVHGIELNEQRQHVNYYFKKQSPGLDRRFERLYDFHQIPGYDEQGYKQVWHVANPNRFTQTRGITGFHAMFDKSGMLEDIDFALLVKQQMASAVSWYEEMASDAPNESAADAAYGSRDTQTRADGTTETIEGISAGSFIRGKRGRKLKMHAPNIPSSETMAHLRWTMQMLSLNLGLPLFVALMDPSEGSFSAWRGALDQAKLGFVRNQALYRDCLHRNVITFNIRRWMAEDPALARAAASRSGKLKIFRHTWHTPSWPYIQPVHDATAATMRIEGYLADPYQVIAENGGNADQVRDRTIKFNGSCIRAAIEEAKQIKADTGVEVAWRDVYNRAVPKGGQVIDQVEEENTVGGTKTKKKAAE